MIGGPQRAHQGNGSGTTDAAPFPLVLLLDHEGAFLPGLGSREQIRLGVAELTWLAGRFGHPGSQHAKHRNPRDGNRLQPARSD